MHVGELYLEISISTCAVVFKQTCPSTNGIPHIHSQMCVCILKVDKLTRQDSIEGLYNATCCSVETADTGAAHHGAVVRAEHPLALPVHGDCRIHRRLQRHLRRAGMLFVCMININDMLSAPSIFQFQI